MTARPGRFPCAGCPTPDAGASLGAVHDAGTGQATFRVWAPAAKAVSVLFFAAWNSGTPSHSLAKDLAGGGDVDQDGWNGVWLTAGGG